MFVVRHYYLEIFYVKILLFGKNGQVGWELVRSLAPLGEVIALDRRSEFFCGDLTNLEGIAQTVRNVQPDVIVNAAAHTAVDQIETEETLPQIINVLAPGVLAVEAKKINAWLVHYSTDYVFDGSGNKPWVETDTPNPLNVYAKTKLDGELKIIASECKHLIFRTSWVHASRGKNFAKMMFNLAKEHKTLKVIDDQFGAPTGAELVADVTAHAIKFAVNKPELTGIYHLVASGEVNWYNYTKFVLDYCRKAGVDFKTPPSGLIAVPTTAFPTPAKRPLNSRLNTNKLQTTFNLTMPDWKNGVIHMLDEFLERK